MKYDFRPQGAPRRKMLAFVPTYNSPARNILAREKTKFSAWNPRLTNLAYALPQVMDKL